MSAPHPNERALIERTWHLPNPGLHRNRRRHQQYRPRPHQPRSDDHLSGKHAHEGIQPAREAA